MKVLVTGANGMLGQDLCPILEDVGCFVIETDVDNLDILDADKVYAVLKEVHPDVVVHCAAYTNVNKAEEDLKGAEAINVTGTENVAEACGKLGITLVYISTDYVFDGTKTEPYTPEDKTNPINNYGMTKYEGEEAVRSLCDKYYIARTSWLYGHHGKNFVETMLGLADKPEIKVVDDQIGCPTWTVELANGIIKLLSQPYGTYHVCGSGSTSWYGFAKEIFRQYNQMSPLPLGEGACRAGEGLIPCSSDEYPSPVKRPAYSVMDNKNICRSWETALHDYLALREV